MDLDLVLISAIIMYPEQETLPPRVFLLLPGKEE